MDAPGPVEDRRSWWFTVSHRRHRPGQRALHGQVSVTSEQIPIPPSSAVATLQSRVAGARSQSGAGQPGARRPTSCSRTPTSLSRSNEPLIVVDGGSSSRGVNHGHSNLVHGEAWYGGEGCRLPPRCTGPGCRRRDPDPHPRGSSIPEGQTQFRWRSEYGTSEIMNPHRLSPPGTTSGWTSRGTSWGSNGQVVSDRFLAATTRFGFQDQQYPGPVFGPCGRPSSALGIASSTPSRWDRTPPGRAGWPPPASRTTRAPPCGENDGYQRTDVRLNVDHRPRDDLSHLPEHLHHVLAPGRTLGGRTAGTSSRSSSPRPM